MRGWDPLPCNRFHRFGPGSFVRHTFRQILDGQFGPLNPAENLSRNRSTNFAPLPRSQAHAYCPLHRARNGHQVCSARPQRVTEQVASTLQAYRVNRFLHF